MIELTEQQLEALDAVPECRFIDPCTRKAYVLVTADAFDRFRKILDEDAGLDMRQVALLVERAMRDDDAHDPTLQFYQEKYGRKP